VQLVVKRFQDNLSWQPWQSVWVLVPLAVLAWISWQIIKGRREFRLHGAFLTFFVCYVLVFDIAASSDFLSWKRVPAGYDPQTVPSHFLLPVPLGDWRYRFLQNSPADQHVSIVLMPERSLAGRRTDLATMIRLALNNHARGIALDMLFPDDLPETMGFINDLFCDSVSAAEKQVTPILFGYSFDVVANGEIRRQPSTTQLPCITPPNSGHLVVLEDTDSSVRSLPLYFRGDRELPALSLRIAAALLQKKTADISVPDNGLLQFVAPSKPAGTIQFEDLKRDTDAGKFLRDQWVLVGEDSHKDSFMTPFNKIPGVMIHAFAAESLIHDRYIRRLPAWQTFLLIFGVCYILTALAAHGVRAMPLIQIVAIATVAIFALAAASVWMWRGWVDTIYFVTSIWLLLPLLLAWRRLKR